MRALALAIVLLVGAGPGAAQAPERIVETFSWNPAPGAVAYRVYACRVDNQKCWRSRWAWTLVAEASQPAFSLPRPTTARWVYLLSNVYPDREEFRRDVLWMLLPPGALWP